MADKARDTRSAEFREATDQPERDEIAYDHFSSVIDEIARQGTTANGPVTDVASSSSEQRVLRQAVAAMVYRALPRTGARAILAHAHQLGAVLRHGIITPSPGGLDHIENAEQLAVLAQQGEAADVEEQRKWQEKANERDAARAARPAHVVVRFPDGDEVD